jgi:hypothetical protein
MICDYYGPYDEYQGYMKLEAALLFGLAPLLVASSDVAGESKELKS